MDRGRGIFGTAITSAYFQKIAANGSHRYGAKSHRSQFGRPSGPGALNIIDASKEICNLHRINDEV